MKFDFFLNILNHLYLILTCKNGGLRRMVFSIGRLNYYQPGFDELYYLRLLLNVQIGSSFNDLRSVNGIVCETYRETCIFGTLI